MGGIGSRRLLLRVGILRRQYVDLHSDGFAVLEVGLVIALCPVDWPRSFTTLHMSSGFYSNERVNYKKGQSWLGA